MKYIKIGMNVCAPVMHKAAFIKINTTYITRNSFVTEIVPSFL